MQGKRLRIAGLAGLLMVAGVAAGGQATQPTGEGSSDKDKPAGMTVGKASVTQHELRIRGESLHYRATAADMLMKDENGKLKATVFFVAYDRLRDAATEAEPATGTASPGHSASADKAGSQGQVDSADKAASQVQADPADKAGSKVQADSADEAKAGEGKATASRPALGEDTPEARPLTFVFNGGPGAAAVWLHLGTAGPRRIRLADEGLAPPPPYALVDNEETWLTFSDLVFIDPIGTGFSRPAEGEKGDQFYGVSEDIRWVSEFIRLYLTTYRRWSSPIFLAGESYGTTRAAGLSDYLVDQHGIALNGIILISSVLSFQTISFSGGNDLAYVLYVPTYAAIAKYHNRLGDAAPDLEPLMDEVQNWAINDYAVALAKGDAISPQDREQIARRLSRYTSLPADLILRSNLRIAAGTFQKELLADRRQIIGRFDGRITGFDLKPAAGWPEYDPSLAQYLPIYTATFNDYVRRQLKYENVLTYEVLSDKVRPWNYGERGSGGYLTVVDDLRSATAKNPYLKIMFASGYYDLATPQFATWYTINHLDLGSLRESITDKHYLGGHMMYHYPAARVDLQRDIGEFVRAALPKP